MADAGSEAGSDAGDAGVDAGSPAAPSEPSFVNGLSELDTDSSREVSVTLVAAGVRYDVRGTIPWLTSTAPPNCQVLKSPGSPAKGCLGNSRRSGGGSSSGGDWD